MSRINLLLDSYHMEGDYLAELDLASTAARKYFDDGFVRGRLARSLAALGRVDEVDAILDEAFAVDNVFELVNLLLVTGKELRVHGWREPTVRVGERWLAWLDSQQSNPDYNTEHPLWRTCRARALGLAERWGEARVVWEDLFEEDPENDSIGKLFSLGRSTYLLGIAKTAAREGDRETALEAQKLLTEGRGGRFAYGAFTLLGAKIAALLGDRDGALALVRQSLAEGYPKPNNLHWLLSADAIRNDGELRELLRPRD